MFKVGDWITTPHRGTFQITHEIELSSWEITLGGKAKLWQPKEGEYCWFWDNGYTTAILAKFEDIKNGKFIEHCGNDFEYCEPFIGILPSFINQ